MHIVQVTKTDLFDLLKSVPKREYIVAHGCNAQGKMGAGFAKQFAENYPSSFEKYKDFIRQRKSTAALGEVVWDTLNKEMVFTASIITQEFYGKDKSVVYANETAIATGLAKVITLARTLCLDVYLPLIGSGYGGLTSADSMCLIKDAVYRSQFHSKMLVNKYVTVCDI